MLMLKKVLITGYIVLSTTLTHATDKWTGPTSPIDPMWGMKGSSIMAEALRDNPLPNPLLDSEKDKAVKEAYEAGRRDAGKSPDKYNKYGDF
jgi:hypothetical protein